MFFLKKNLFSKIKRNYFEASISKTEKDKYMTMQYIMYDIYSQSKYSRNNR